MSLARVRASPKTAGAHPAAQAGALLEDALATWRLVRLAHDDYITQPLRDRLYDVLDGDASGEDPDIGTCTCKHPKEQHAAGSDMHSDASACAADCECREYQPLASARVARLRHPKLTTLMECPHCLAVWGAATVVLLRYLRLGWAVSLLAASAVASELARRTDR